MPYQSSKLKDARLATGMTLNNVAVAFATRFQRPYSRQQISDWESEKGPTPGVRFLEVFAELYHVPITYFLEDETEPEPVGKVKAALGKK